MPSAAAGMLSNPISQSAASLAFGKDRGVAVTRRRLRSEVVNDTAFQDGNKGPKLALSWKVGSVGSSQTVRVASGYFTRFAVNSMR
jgi:hypothetical protein